MGRSQRHLQEIQGYDSNMRREPNAPTDITLTPATIANGAANGTDVGVLAATGDLDVSESFVQSSYGLSGAGATGFGLNTTGGNVVIEKTGSLTAGAKVVTVTVTDRFGLTFSKDITITVT